MKIKTIHSFRKTLLKSNFKKGNSKYLVRFTPSIVHIKDNTFLLSYRVWKRADYLKIPKYAGNRGHPWYNYWGYLSYDGTAFAMISIDKNQNIKILKDKIYPNWMVDTRLIKNNNKIYVVYNYFGKLNPLKHPKEYKNYRKCSYAYDKDKQKVLYNPTRQGLKELKFKGNNINSFMNKSPCHMLITAELDLDKELRPKISNPRVVCPKFHNTIEKNHIPFFINDKMYTLYSLTPLVIFSPECKKLFPKSKLFDNIVKFYDKREIGPFKKYLQISGSTPFVKEGKELIAAGHFKVQLSKLKHIPKNTSLEKMLITIKSNFKLRNFSNNFENNLNIPNIRYDTLIYGMFFFSLDAKTFKIKRCSDFFLFKDNQKKMSLVYPAGFVRKDKEYILSYHEADSSVKLMFLKENEINSLLKHNNNTKPRDFNFLLV